MSLSLLSEKGERMTREYLKDLEPEEVTERLNKGEEVFYTDTKGAHHSYKFINGICVRYTDGEVDGYGRSIYSTGECYFESKEEITLRPGKRYRTRDGRIAIVTTVTDGSWIKGFIVDTNRGVLTASWKENGLFYGECSEDPRDLVEELD